MASNVAQNEGYKLATLLIQYKDSLNPMTYLTARSEKTAKKAPFIGSEAFYVLTISILIAVAILAISLYRATPV